MWHHQNLGQGFCQVCKAPCPSNEERHGFCLGPGSEGVYGMKQAIVTAPCLQPIDYHSDCCVIMAVNSSFIATGFILSQLSVDDKQFQSCFSSIMWNEQESLYSQAKIEIYGLLCALQAYWLYIIGVKNLQMEIHMSYIKGMLNNPDIQPGTAVNRWFVGIQ